MLVPSIIVNQEATKTSSDSCNSSQSFVLYQFPHEIINICPVTQLFEQVRSDNKICIEAQRRINWFYAPIRRWERNIDVIERSKENRIC